MHDAGRPQAPIISNTRSDRVRDVAKLAGRPARLKRGQFLAEGPQAVREALAAHRNRAPSERPVVVQLFATPECLNRFPEFAEPISDVKLRRATDEVLAVMADTVSSQGIIAVCNTIDVQLTEVLERRPRLIAVFSRMRDPGNAGAVLRAADAAGADAVVITASSVDIYNPKAVRSTAGSIFHLPVVVGEDLAALTGRLDESGLQLLAAHGYGNHDLDVLQDECAARRLRRCDEDAPSSTNTGDRQGPALESPTAWIFGNEAQGLSEAELARTDYSVSVPVYGSAESLNLATAATVCLYASARAQRTMTPAD
ncbi:MAG TPA: RNA methyltransferase [Arthrobacter sp.]|nr:RNA methyltransferase [Arthrobacter sp.]